LGELDVELGKDLLEQVRQLSVHLCGDATDASVARVVEMALKMRLLWESQANVGPSAMEEPVTNWEFPNASGPTSERLPHNLGGWLFGGRRDGSSEGDR
jgi:hypothetical protein